MDPLTARNLTAEKANAIRRRFLRESYGDAYMPKPIPLQLDADMYETFQSLPDVPLTLSDLLLIQIMRELQRSRPTTESPSASPAEKQVVLAQPETPAAESTT